MIENASTVVSQPIPVVEAMVRDVSSWTTLFDEVEDVSRLARDRYFVQLRRGRRVRSAVLRVYRQAADHQVSWRTLNGPAWSGELRLVALTGRRTAVHLTFDRTPRGVRLRSGPPDGVPGGVPDGVPGGVPGGAPDGVSGGAPDGVSGGAPDAVSGGAPDAVSGGAPDGVPGAASRRLRGGLRGQLRGIAPALARVVTRRSPVGGLAKRDLCRLQERVDALPRPVRPRRMGPLPGARPVEDILIIDGLRRRPEASQTEVSG